MTRLFYCPKCTADLRASTIFKVVRQPEGDGGYNVRCAVCQWSGEIFPEDEQCAAEEPK